jgi:biopolymer transport protein ExbD
MIPPGSTRRKPRRLHHEEVGLQIAPMIDVTLLLLFFFMLSGKLTKSARLMQIRVPQADASKVPENTGEREVINIDAGGAWFCGDQPVSTTELAARLRQRFAQHPPLKLQVRADAETPASRIKELISLAAEAGALEVVYGVAKP